MALRLKYRTGHYKTPRRELRSTFSDINNSNAFLGLSSKAIEIKSKNKQGEPNQT